MIAGELQHGVAYSIQFASDDRLIGGVTNGDYAVVVNAAVEERPRQGDRI